MCSSFRVYTSEQWLARSVWLHRLLHCISESNHVSNKNHCMSTLLQPVPLEPHQRRNLPGSQLLGRQKKQLIIPRTVRVSLLNQVSANLCILFHSLIDLRLLGPFWILLNTSLTWFYSQLINQRMTPMTHHRPSSVVPLGMKPIELAVWGVLVEILAIALGKYYRHSFR